jgi:hypothetical protein
MKYLAFAIVALPSLALAGPKLTLDQGDVLGTITAEINASRGAVGKPVSIAPDLALGATDDLTFAIVHSTFGTTGFRGGTGDGICVTGTDGGCPHVYRNVGGEAQYSLQEGELAMAAVLGVYSLDVDARWIDLKLGARTKYTGGPVSVSFTPSIYVGMNHRPENLHQLYLPIGLSVKVAPVLALGLGSGIKGPIDGLSSFGRGYTVPIGANMVVSPSKAFAIGASFTFGKLFGSPDLPPNTTGTDSRGIHVWVTVTP